MKISLIDPPIDAYDGDMSYFGIIWILKNPTDGGWGVTLNENVINTTWDVSKRIWVIPPSKGSIGGSIKDILKIDTVASLQGCQLLWKF